MRGVVLIIREDNTSNIKTIKFIDKYTMDYYINNDDFTKKYTVLWSDLIEDRVYYMVVRVNKELE